MSRRFFWAFQILLGLAVVLVLFTQWRRRQVPPLPTMGEVPAFQFTDQTGRTVGLSDLSGKVWVASFIFTSCGGPCPAVTANVSSLQKEFASREDVQFVSFTVDPETDTPQVLADYAVKLGAPAAQWHFLTGAKSELYDLARKGFLLSVGDQTDPQAESPFFHSTKLVLVDRRGVIRGYYEGETADGAGKAAPDIRRLLENR